MNINFSSLSNPIITFFQTKPNAVTSQHKKILAVALMAIGFFSAYRLLKLLCFKATLVNEIREIGRKDILIEERTDGLVETNSNEKADKSTPLELVEPTINHVETPKDPLNDLQNVIPKQEVDNPHSVQHKKDNSVAENKTKKSSQKKFTKLLQEVKKRHSFSEIPREELTGLDAYQLIVLRTTHVSENLVEKSPDDNGVDPSEWDG